MLERATRGRPGRVHCRLRCHSRIDSARHCFSQLATWTKGHRSWDFEGIRLETPHRAGGYDTNGGCAS